MGLITKRMPSAVQASWNGWKYQNSAQVPAQGSATSWSSLRDVALHIQKNDYYRPYLTISWTDAYIAAGMTERIYLLGPTGRLIKRLVVSSTSGSTTIQMTGGYGQYTLHIPGYSTRNWTVSVPNAYPNQIEPVKVHQSMGATPSVYLKVPANTGFTLCGRRDTSGITAVTITNVADGADTYTLSLTTQTYYDQYNSSVRSSTGVDRVFAVTFTGSGRTAFWVDGIPNLFAKAQAQLFDLTNSAGTASVTVGDEIGSAPLFGATLPYQALTAGEETVIESWGMTATSRYHNQTHLEANPSHDVAFLEYDRDTLNVDAYLQTIRSNPTVISNTATTITFYETYADARITANLLTDAYFAFADEPNLNYTTVTDYESHFVTIATALKNNADPQVASMKLAFPQSSKMTHGPLTGNSDVRRGYDMLDRVLPDNWDLIDAITWHSWNVRDLINTDFYYDDITATYDLMISHMPEGGTPKPLMIGQTNIQSGNTTSTYEQDTFYASQWWTSVFIQCARTGKLQSLIWFLALSDGHHEKGFATTTGGVTTEKIVADSQKFLAAHYGQTVLSTSSNHPELDVVTMKNASDELRIIGVNKGPRTITATIALPEYYESVSTYYLDANGSSSDTETVNNTSITLAIPANTIFAISSTLGGTGGTQLAAGHYVAQRFDMDVVYPRPDNETGTYARHRWAYYDGTNNVQYEVPVKVFGGSAPHRFTLISSPAGATITNDYTDMTQHGVIKWTPSGNVTGATFTVRVTGQDGNSVDRSWTVTTSSSTDRFMFVDDTGSAVNSGAIGSPKRLVDMTGATKTTTTYPNRIVYMRAGSYATTAHSDAWNGGNGGEAVKCRIELNATYHPVAYVAYPGEAVTIDFSAAEITIGHYATNNSANDFLFSGSSTAKLTISGSADDALETHNLWQPSRQQRCGFQWLQFDGFVPRINGNYTNSTPIFTSGSDAGKNRKYLHIHAVDEINRAGPHTNNESVICTLFGVDYFVIDACYAHPADATTGITVKDTCYHGSVRYNDIYLPTGDGNEFAIANIGQTDSGWLEFSYNFCGGKLWTNKSTHILSGNVYSDRNTVYSTDSNYGPGIIAWVPSSGSGAIYSEGDAVVSVSSPHISAGAGGTYNIVDSNAECQATTASGDKPFNTTTGALVNGGTSWRTTYLGTRGWEIA